MRKKSPRRGSLPEYVTEILKNALYEKGEQFGKPRLREVIQNTAHGPAQAIVNAIAERLAAFRGTSPAVDDVTFVIIKVIGRTGAESDSQG